MAAITSPTCQCEIRACNETVFAQVALPKLQLCLQEPNIKGGKHVSRIMCFQCMHVLQTVVTSDWRIHKSIPMVGHLSQRARLTLAICKSFVVNACDNDQRKT